jgi:uncharacterized protein (TIGR03435 family)
MRWTTAAIYSVPLVFLARAAFSQAPSFEIATVKPSTPESGPIAIKRTPGLFQTFSTPISFLIRWAYDLDEDRLIGSNGRLDSQPFDIVAKIPEGPLAPGQLKLMMQSLLTERFKLRIHRETRTLQIYALEAMKSGLKVRFVDPEGGIAQDPFKMTDRGRIVGTGVTADMLAKVLAAQIGRTVKDETGITRRFDFVLEWSPDLVNPPALQDQPSRLSIFSAVQEQLGMRLEARRTLTEVIAIDSVREQPGDN